MIYNESVKELKPLVTKSLKTQITQGLNDEIQIKSKALKRENIKYKLSSWENGQGMLVINSSKSFKWIIDPLFIVEYESFQKFGH